MKGIGTMPKTMCKEEVLEMLTKLYYICYDNSSETDDSWFRMAGAISTAEDVAIQEINNEKG